MVICLNSIWSPDFNSILHTFLLPRAHTPDRNSLGSEVSWSSTCGYWPPKTVSKLSKLCTSMLSSERRPVLGWVQRCHVYFQTPWISSLTDSASSSPVVHTNSNGSPTSIAQCRPHVGGLGKLTTAREMIVLLSPCRARWMPISPEWKHLRGRGQLVLSKQLEGWFLTQDYHVSPPVIFSCRV